jgi:hypothetical protein
MDSEVPGCDWMAPFLDLWGSNTSHGQNCPSHGQKIRKEEGARAPLFCRSQTPNDLMISH